METVAIFGVGLIGGSFGLALRKAGFAGELLGVSSKPAVECGLRLGAISRSATLEEAVSEADLIYLAQPVDRILKTLEELGSSAPSECLITDAGSTKSVIVEKASSCLPAQAFLGGHPMAGKEQRGVEAADPDLFRGRPYVLTPISPQTERSNDFRVWLSRIGAIVIDTSPAEHDAAVAFTSHLPQLLSTALAGTLAVQNSELLAEVFGSGLLDMTRLALSAPDLWVSILATNKGEVVRAIDGFLECLTKLRQSILADVPASFFTEAARFAERLRKPTCTKSPLSC